MQFSEAVDIEKWEEPIARVVIPSPPSAARGRLSGSAGEESLIRSWS